MPEGLCDLKRNLTMLTDFYELTMANGYFTNGFKNKIAYFDMFFRKIPDGGGFAIMAGLQQLIEYIENISFSSDDIDYLKSKGIFCAEFLNYLKEFKFSCDIWAVPEGTPIFPKEPIVTVRGPVIEAQFIETMLLLAINHQSLIATKANRIVKSAGKRAVMEFGSRRAHGFDSAVYGSRAAFIGGCCGTACTISDRDFGIPALGTMAHSWVQLFDNELEAFRAYAKTYPSDCTLLIDTYNTLKSGIKNAVKVFKEEIVPMGYRPKGVRIDSGDITYLSIKVREILDKEGFNDCKIIASNALDEYIIRDMIIQGARVDIFGVGERLITASSEPVFGGVYKIVGTEKDDKFIPKIKISENVAKMTTPGFKNLWRLFDNATGKAIADVITMFDETIDDSRPYEIFDSEYTWKRKVICNFKAVKIRKQIFKAGTRCYSSPSVKDIKFYCAKQIETLWDEVTRFENPHNYYVDLSQKLWNQKQTLINNNKF